MSVSTISWPFAPHIGFIYTGLSDGRIIRFDSGLKAYTTVQRLGEPPYDKCGKLHLKSFQAFLPYLKCYGVTEREKVVHHVDPTISSFCMNMERKTPSGLFKRGKEAS